MEYPVSGQYMDMARSTTSGRLASIYENRIGTATNANEVAGYWAFLAGVVIGMLGLVVYFVTDAATMGRGVGYGLAALAPALLLHPVMGLLVAAPTFRATATGLPIAARRRAFALLGVGLLAAMAGHVWWNTGGAVTIAGWIHPSCRLGI
jgi:hypothetical protein